MDIEDKKIEEIVKKQWQKMPVEIQNALSVSGWENKIIELGKRHGLRVDQLGMFQQETLLVLLGLVHPDQYIHELQTRLNVVAPKAEALANDADKEIFSGIREKLKEVYGNNDETEIDTDEERTLEKTGIDVDANNEEEKISVKESRTDLLSEIEHPELIPSSPQKDFISSKLTDTFTIPKTETDSSLNPITTPKTAPPRSDPYREQI